MLDHNPAPMFQTHRNPGAIRAASRAGFKAHIRRELRAHRMADPVPALIDMIKDEIGNDSLKEVLDVVLEIYRADPPHHWAAADALSAAAGDVAYDYLEGDG